ncbi:MAG: peptidoglycan DD-metalloendopeptidase family protein [Psychromonas sp.]
MTSANLISRKNTPAMLASYLFLFFIFTLSIPTSFAANDLSKIQQQIEASKNNKNKQTQKSELLAELVANSEKEAAVATLQAQETKQAIEEEDKRLKELIQQTTTLEEDKINQQKILEQQLVSAYMAGKNDLIKLILNQEDISKIVRAKGYYQYLNDARLESIRTLSETQQQLETNKSEQAKALLALEGLYAQQKATEKELIKQGEQRSKALRELKQDLSYQNALLDQLGDEQKRLAEKLKKEKEARQERELAAAKERARQKLEVKSAEKTYSSISKQRGQLNWPIKGDVLSTFGSQRSSQVKWKGITIDANEGEKVRAVSSGRVLFAGYFKGYGMVIALDHSDDYISLYGYNQTLLQKTGDIILQGDAIALAGHSGGQDINSLYFELSYKGTAQDPLLWLKKK